MAFTPPTFPDDLHPDARKVLTQNAELFMDQRHREMTEEEVQGWVEAARDAVRQCFDHGGDLRTVVDQAINKKGVGLDKWEYLNTGYNNTEEKRDETRRGKKRRVYKKGHHEG